MKEFILLLFLVISFLADAQQKNIPASLKEKFSSENPTVKNVMWSADSTNYRVNFSDKENLNHIVVYDSTGKIIRSEHELVQKDIPTAIQNYYNDKFPTEKTYSVWVVEDANGNRTYYTNRKDETIYFDKTGQVTKGVAPSIH